MTYPVQDAWVQSLSDSVYGDVSRLGGDCAVPAPLPYSCTFFGDFIGQAGETQTNTLTATQTTGPTGPDYFPQPPYTRSGSATVSLTGLSVLAAVKKSCKKGLRPKTVRTKHGKKQKCVRKKSRP
jgi:hypothetical protein